MLDKEYELFCTKADEELTRTISKMFSIYTVLKDTEITYLSRSMEKQMNSNDKYTLAIFLAGLSVNDDITCFFKDNNITMKIVTDSFKISLDNLEELNKEEFKELFIDSYKFLKRISEPLSLEDTTSKILVANALYDYCTNSDVINCLFKKNDLNLEMVRNNFTEFIGSPSMNDKFKASIDNSFISKVASDLKEFGDYLSINKDDIVGRNREVRRLEASLISPGSAILIGEAGVGKTAIVEKIAYLMNSGNVPTVLKNRKIFNLDLSKIVANTIYRGELEGKLNRLITTLDKHDNIILFIDEIHMIMGAGSCDSNKIDVANFLKPYLSSGKVQVIGATTKEEYEKSILNDKAFRRRFNVITVSEPDKEMLIDILMMKKNNYEKYLNIEMEDSFEVINMLTDLTSKEHRNYQDNISNPALAVNILGRAFAYAAIDEKKSITKSDFKEAILEEETLYQGVREEYVRRLTTKSEKIKKKIISFPKK